MNQKTLIQGLETLVGDCHESIQRLSEMQENDIPAIEIALMESKLISLYDEIQQLKKFKRQNRQPENIQPIIEKMKSDVSELKKIQLVDNNDINIVLSTGKGAEIIEESESEVIEESLVNEQRFFQFEMESPTEPPATEFVESQPEPEKKVEVASPVVPETPEIESSVEPTFEKDVEEIEEETKSVNPPIETVEAVNNETFTEKPKQVPVNAEATNASDNSSINDRFGKKETQSLNDRLAANKEKQSELSKKLTGARVTDVKKAISLNQQIVFTRELFENDKKSYRKALDFINKANTYSEARSYLHLELLDKHNITEDSIHYQEFITLIKRKFM